MNDFKNIPPSMRYLGARLKPFRRPLFWGSLGLASLIGLTLYQYWQHPDWLTGSLSEIKTNSNSSLNNLSNSIEREKISAEDLAIGAELDNLDLLLKELEQNQTIPLNQSKKSKKSKKSNDSLQLGNKNTTYHRFQEQQKSKLRRSPDPLIPTKTSASNLVTSPTRNMFKLPSFNGYNPTVSNSPNSEIIPNPVGRLYLSDRNRLNNTFTSNSVNSFSPINSSSINRQITDRNASSQNNSNFSTSEIRANTGEADNYITPSAIPYNNSINSTLIPPRPAYKQPIYQQPTNFGVNPSIVENQNLNLPTRFPSSTLSNQEQTQRYYQLTPSNYQLQPQGYSQPNVNSGLNAPQNNSFSSPGSFNNSQFNNN